MLSCLCILHPVWLPCSLKISSLPPIDIEQRSKLVFTKLTFFFVGVAIVLLAVETVLWHQTISYVIKPSLHHSFVISKKNPLVHIQAGSAFSHFFLPNLVPFSSTTKLGHLLCILFQVLFPVMQIEHINHCTEEAEMGWKWFGSY